MIKMEASTSSGSSGDDPILTSIEWTDEDLLALSEAVISEGRCLIPAGLNKHFNMILILKKFHSATKKKVESKVLWDKIKEEFDLDKLDSLMPCPFPNEQCDFSLPENDFSQLIRDRKNQSSQDKLHDEESRDSGSGRETPPTLPIAKRGAALQSSSKRKYSASFSDTGSDAGSTGRKSTGTKSKRSRI